MKHIKTLCAAALGLILACGTTASAEEVRTVTTTTAGTISEFSPDTIVVRRAEAAEPLRYSYTRETTYVDEAGAPVSLELVKAGLPVTVHYVNEGPRVIARKVIVHRAVPAAPVIEKRTTTTTTRKVDDDDDDDDDDND